MPGGRPALGRRPRRRHGLVLVLFALAAFVLVALCVAALGPAGREPEGMLWMSLALMGLMLLAVGCALLLVGILLLTHRGRVEPAWFVDPDDPGLARWWDGRVWTEHTETRSPETRALVPLRSSSSRRRVVGAGMLLGGIVVAVGSSAVAQATVTPASGASTGQSSIYLLASQLTVPAALIAVCGLYLLLTLSPDVRPGWYADPLDRGRLRWWDGLAWGDAVRAGES